MRRGPSWPAPRARFACASPRRICSARAPSDHHLDLSAFDGVFEVDPTNRTATVGGLTTYEDLVDATLPHGLVPLCVPQLRTITLGGAVTGLGIEAASFRNGCPHESVLGMDVLTGSGDVVHATAGGENEDLFFGFPNSYGSLGYALRLKIELEPVARSSGCATSASMTCWTWPRRWRRSPASAASTARPWTTWMRRCSAATRCT